MGCGCLIMRRHLSTPVSIHGTDPTPFLSRPKIAWVPVATDRDLCLHLVPARQRCTYCRPRLSNAVHNVPRFWLALGLGRAGGRDQNLSETVTLKKVRTRAGGALISCQVASEQGWGSTWQARSLAKRNSRFVGGSFQCRSDSGLSALVSRP